MSIVNLATKAKKVLYAKVLYPYKPQAAGELRLRVGDTVKNVTRLAKGWCKVSFRTEHNIKRHSLLILL